MVTYDSVAVVEKDGSFILPRTPFLIEERLRFVSSPFNITDVKWKKTTDNDCSDEDDNNHSPKNSPFSLVTGTLLSL